MNWILLIELYRNNYILISRFMKKSIYSSHSIFYLGSLLFIKNGLTWLKIKALRSKEFTLWQFKDCMHPKKRLIYAFFGIWHVPTKYKFLVFIIMIFRMFEFLEISFILLYSYNTEFEVLNHLIKDFKNCILRRRMIFQKLELYKMSFASIYLL